MIVSAIRSCCRLRIVQTRARLESKKEGYDSWENLKTTGEPQGHFCDTKQQWLCYNRNLIMSTIREPSVSGTFYPANPEVLKADIEGYLKKASLENVPAGVVGLVSPHAGYMYSGQTAAHGYKTLSGNHYNTVIIVAPSHQSFFYGAAVQAKGGYKTPLGVVPIDEDLSARLVGNGELVHADDRAHRGEHSVEVQIPFLQTVLDEFMIVPLILGMSQDMGYSVQLADFIHQNLDSGKRYLIVGSTDLSHYYPYDLAKELDNEAIELIRKYDIEGLDRELARGKYEACGAGSIVTAMAVSRKLGATRSEVLDYKNSGDVTGDMSNVVGYVSSVFY
jgi:MEMO1 family protein